MAEKKHQLKMAKATKSDIKNLILLYNVLENIVKYGAESKDEFNHFDEKEKKHLNRIFGKEGEIDYEELTNYLHSLTFGLHRVVMGYEVLFNNCADPKLDHLDFNSRIENAFLVFDDLKEKLEQGLQVTVTSDSVLGHIILGKNESQEVDNG